MGRLIGFLRENGGGILFTVIMLLLFGIAGGIETGRIWP